MSDFIFTYCFPYPKYNNDAIIIHVNINIFIAGGNDDGDNVIGNINASTCSHMDGNRYHFSVVIM